MGTEEQSTQESEREGKLALDRDDPDHDFVDQSKIDFDPDDGLYSGTAVQGDSEIPGPHYDHDTGEMTGMDEAREEFKKQQDQQQQEQNQPQQQQDQDQQQDQQQEDQRA